MESIETEGNIGMKWINLEFQPLPEKCPYSGFFWSVLSRTRNKYGVGEILRISTCFVRMRENKDQKNSDYGHFYAMSLREQTFL